MTQDTSFTKFMSSVELESRTLFWFEKNGKVGLVDGAGNTVLDFKYVPIPPQPPVPNTQEKFDTDLELRKQWREYARCGDSYTFNNGFASVILDDEEFNMEIIDVDGNTVLQLPPQTNVIDPVFVGDYFTLVIKALNKSSWSTILVDKNMRNFDVTKYLDPIVNGSPHYNMAATEDNVFTFKFFELGDHDPKKIIRWSIDEPTLGCFKIIPKEEN